MSQSSLQELRCRTDTKPENFTKMLLKTKEVDWKIDDRKVAVSNVELGKGKWGTVSVGTFQGRSVAVKQLHQEIITQQHILRIDCEIYILSQLHHPNIIEFIGAVFDLSLNRMIVTEIMDTSLIHAYENQELTPDISCRPVILSIMRDIAQGLNYLHCLPDPVIHRDIDSDNVLLKSVGDRKWKAKISDFGSANFVRLSYNPYPGAIAYSAPETRRGPYEQLYKRQTPKVDSFSYGILLCEAITCHFPEPSLLQGLLQKVQLSSKPLHDIISSCIKKEPHERPTMEQIMENLNHIFCTGINYVL